jgi:cyclopropane fatty-acyl-phospholipid synthase-like methyltransferase
MEATMNSTTEYFDTRFAKDDRRDVLWRALWEHFFRRWIRPEDCVLELGAGYGHFINHVQARRRIAVDMWPGFTKFLQPGIEGHVAAVDQLEFLQPASVDFAFASNLFEHISQETLATVLERLRVCFTKQGTLTIIQPNYYYCYREYFDDYTHRTVYSHTSLCDFLEAHGFEVFDARPRFLPLTIKSRLPVSATLIRLYLLSPWKLMGKQMLIRARPRTDARG